jgi:hypothetical protein
MKRITCLVIVALLTFGLVFAQTDRKKKLSPPKQNWEHLGKLSANPYDPDSVSNPFGIHGSPYSPKSVTNPYSLPGFKANNPYAVGGPRIIGHDGTYLGRLNKNKFDPESIANPYGIYGSKFSPLSVKNPYGIYGSKYSPFSATNPHATQAPKLFGVDSLQPDRLRVLDSLDGSGGFGTDSLLDFGLDDWSDPE